MSEAGKLQPLASFKPINAQICFLNQSFCQQTEAKQEPSESTKYLQSFTFS